MAAECVDDLAGGLGRDLRDPVHGDRRRGDRIRDRPCARSAAVAYQTRRAHAERDRLQHPRQDRQHRAIHPVHHPHGPASRRDASDRRHLHRHRGDDRADRGRDCAVLRPAGRERAAGDRPRPGRSGQGIRPGHARHHMARVPARRARADHPSVGAVVHQRGRLLRHGWRGRWRWFG